MAYALLLASAVITLLLFYANVRWYFNLLEWYNALAKDEEKTARPPTDTESQPLQEEQKAQEKQDNARPRLGASLVQFSVYFFRVRYLVGCYSWKTTTGRWPVR